MAGTLVAHYRVLEQKVRGGMGEVYRGEDWLLHRDVAIKTLLPELAEDPDFRERFRREARTLAGLRHPNIVTLYDFFEEGGRYYMVMEAVGGETFLDLIQSHPEGLPWREAMVLAAAVLSALEHAHGRGVIHLDIKPANLLLAVDGSVRVLDFGVARNPDAEIPAAGGALAGTLRYMSPEQRAGANLDSRSDLYSLALVLFELLGGDPPDGDEHEPHSGETEMRHTLRRLRPDLPEGLESLLAKALSRKPEARFDSAREFRLMLEGTLREALLTVDGPRIGAPAVARLRPAGAEPTVIRPR